MQHKFVSTYFSVNSTFLNVATRRWLATANKAVASLNWLKSKAGIQCRSQWLALSLLWFRWASRAESWILKSHVVVFSSGRMFDRGRGLFRPFIGAATGLHVIAWPCGRADAQNIMRPPGRVWVRMHATHLAGFLRGHSTRVCVWVIKESDCHIRRPTREGCGLCPSLFLRNIDSPRFYPSPCPAWLALGHVTLPVSNPRRGLVFETSFFLLLYVSFPLFLPPSFPPFRALGFNRFTGA